nr:hypothetical protein [Pseudonocardiales bacterium]
MRHENVPVLDARYWLALLLASVVGTTFGDFVSEDLGLTFAGALVPLATVFALVLVAERRISIATVAWYWVAVIIFRSTSTNLGDTVSRTLGLGYGWVSLALGLLLAAYVFAMTRSSSSVAFANAAGAERKALTVNARYWVALLIASVFGTTFGDFMSDDTGLGFGRASLLLVSILAVAVVVELRAKRPSDARYWAIIAVVRTAGTTVGDWMTEGEPGMGFALGAVVAAALLIVVLVEPWVTTYPPETLTALRAWKSGASGSEQE